MKTCAAVGCKKSINDEMLMCREHWYRVPAELRTQIWELYNFKKRNVAGAAEKHLAACRRAIRVVYKAEKQSS